MVNGCSVAGNTDASVGVRGINSVFASLVHRCRRAWGLVDLVQMETLPDYLKEGLDIIFVGLNPSAYSARVGHYFANPRNRFWTAFNRSGLVKAELSAAQDGTLLDHGIGFTDLVKRPTPQASELTSEDYLQGAPVLKGKLERYRPLVACFHGLTAYRQYLRYGEGVKAKPELGLQERTIGGSKVFVIPNPSPANARFSVEDLANWYLKVNEIRNELRGAIVGLPGDNTIPLQSPD